MLPPVEFLDTEVVTNVSIPSLTQGVRKYSFLMAFNATTSNNVEIAFGMDEDGDGTLCDDEVSLSAGWDCGEWFIMNVATGERFADIGANGPHELNGGILLRADGRVRSVAFCDDITPLFNTSLQHSLDICEIMEIPCLMEHGTTSRTWRQHPYRRAILHIRNTTRFRYSSAMTF